MSGIPYTTAEVFPLYTIGLIKALVERATGVPTEHQKLIAPTIPPAVPVVLKDPVTLRMLGHPTFLTMIVDSTNHTLQKNIQIIIFNLSELFSC